MNQEIPSKSQKSGPLEACFFVQAYQDNLKNDFFMNCNRLCKSCGLSFKKNGTKFCSNNCKILSLGKLKKCKPRCNDSSLDIRVVVFKDGTNHIQQFCDRCQVTSFKPKIWGVRAGLVEDCFEMDFLTDAAKSGLR